MVYWAFVFLVVALFAAAVGFALAPAGLAVIAKALCVMFVGLFVVSAVAVMARPRGIGRA